MAITRAQQAKQMLQDGGMLVKPGNGKRPGYRSARAQSNRTGGGSRTGSSSARERGAERSRSSNRSSTSKTSSTGFGGGDDRREQESVTQTRTGTVRTSKTGPRTKVSRDTRDRQRRRYDQQFLSRGQLPPVGSRPTSFRDKISRRRQQGILDFINRDLITNLSRFEEEPRDGLFGSYPISSIYDEISDAIAARKDLSNIKEFSNLTPIGKSGTSSEMSAVPDLDLDSIRELASVRTTLQGQPLTKYQSNLLSDIREGIRNRDELVEQGMTQNRFEELYPPPKPRPDDAGRPSDPCLGPNPPSYCFIGKKADQTAQNAIARNLGGLSPRVGGSIFDFTGLADGGRVSAMDGGIMDLVREEMFLGGIVKGIKKGIKGATRAIKKVAKSPFGKAALGFAALKFGVPFLKEKGLGKFFLKDAAKGFSLDNLSDKGVFAGIAGLSALAGLTAPKQDEDKFDIDAYYASSRLDPNPDLFPRILGSQFTESAADGGRIGYAEAGGVISEKEMKKLAKSPLYKGFKKMYGVDPSMARDNPAYDEKFDTFEKLYKEGFQKGGNVEPVAKKTMPLLDMGGQEMDLRAEGGFVPIGRMEKADDVPARLSKNEFVFTAEAVRNAGDGDVDKGAEVMYNMMKNLEDGGNVSEESQGLEGARRMFQTSKRLEEVL